MVMSILFFMAMTIAVECSAALPITVDEDDADEILIFSSRRAAPSTDPTGHLTHPSDEKRGYRKKCSGCPLLLILAPFSSAGPFRHFPIIALRGESEFWLFLHNQGEKKIQDTMVEGSTMEM